MCGGTAAIDMPTESRSRPQVPHTMTALIARLTSGSIQSQPVSRITRPAATTPTETSASAAMCRNAPRKVEIVLAAGGEQQRGDAVDDDADGGDHHHRPPDTGSGSPETAESPPTKCAHRHQQKHRVEQRGQDRRAAQSVGEARGRRALGQHARDPGDARPRTSPRLWPASASSDTELLMKP